MCKDSPVNGTSATIFRLVSGWRATLAATRPPHPFTGRRDPTGHADDRALLDEPVGHDDGAVFDDERGWVLSHLPAAGLAAAERPNWIAGMPFLTEIFRPDVFGLA